MLGIVLDIGCGYLISRLINRMWLAILASVIGGIIIAFAANMLLGTPPADQAAFDEFMRKVASGVMLNPLIILAALMVFRRTNGEPTKQ